MITTGNILILLLAVLAFLAGGVATILIRSGKAVPAWSRLVCMTIGILLCLALLIWHAIQTGTWEPLQDNLSAMVTLALLLAGFVAYIQSKRPIASLEWLVMPLVIVLLLLAGHFGATQPHPYMSSAYSLIHRLFTYLGTLAFVVAGASGVLYLMSDRMLRPRHAEGARPLPPKPALFGSLERLEHLTYSAVILGFALFTIGIITGIAWIAHENWHTSLGRYWFLTPKVLLAFASWLVFVIVLHTPIAPRLRGRKTALLSIVGVLLVLATLFVVLLSRKGGA